MQLSPLTILDAPCNAEHEVKKSVFQAFAEPLASPAHADQLLKKHYRSDARHHCWAWRCNGEYRFNDDGEPAGTAGRPILQAMEGADIERALVVVRRYFGGIKLGAGGLVRAYSAAAAACLDTAQTRQLTPHVQLTLQVPFEHTQALFQLLAEHQTSAPEHDSHGVRIQALVALRDSDALIDSLNSHTHGLVRVTRGETLLA